MENDLQAHRTDTLFSELGNWNRQENKFREVFSDEALKDREFQKMKLETYDRLYNKYRGKPLTQDERAMLTMLRFQRRKMEKALYPGLLTRMLRRGIGLVKNLWARQRESVAVNRENLHQYTHHAPNLGPRGDETPQQKNEQRQEASLRRMPRQYPMMRKQSRMKQHRKKGHGI